MPEGGAAERYWFSDESRLTELVAMFDASSELETVTEAYSRIRYATDPIQLATDIMGTLTPEQMIMLERIFPPIHLDDDVSCYSVQSGEIGHYGGINISAERANELREQAEEFERYRLGHWSRPMNFTPERMGVADINALLRGPSYDYITSMK
jgi:hypothetical protein